MAIPQAVRSAAGGGPLTPADVQREWAAHPFPDEARPSNAQLMDKLGLLPSSWNEALRAGLPAGGTVAEIRQWLLSNGWLE